MLGIEPNTLHTSPNLFDHYPESAPIIQVEKLVSTLVSANENEVMWPAV